MNLLFLAQLIVLPFPNVHDAKYDQVPIGALEITAPKDPSTRNFTAGILVTTHSDTMDKSRGIFVNNQSSKSDAFYAANTGGGCGFCVDTGDSKLITGGTSYASEVRDHNAVGLYIQSTPTAYSPRLQWLDQKSSLGLAFATAVITLSGNAPNIGYQVLNTGGNRDSTAFQAQNSQDQVTFHVRPEDGWLYVNNLTIGNLTGPGSGYACLTPAGLLFRSNTPCR